MSLLLEALQAAEKDRSDDTQDNSPKEVKSPAFELGNFDQDPTQEGQEVKSPAFELGNFDQDPTSDTDDSEFTLSFQEDSDDKDPEDIDLMLSLDVDDTKKGKSKGDSAGLYSTLLNKGVLSDQEEASDDSELTFTPLADAPAGDLETIEYSGSTFVPSSQNNEGKEDANLSLLFKERQEPVVAPLEKEPEKPTLSAPIPTTDSPVENSSPEVSSKDSPKIHKKTKIPLIVNSLTPKGEKRRFSGLPKVSPLIVGGVLVLLGGLGVGGYLLDEALNPEDSFKPRKTTRNQGIRPPQPKKQSRDKPILSAHPISSGTEQQQAREVVAPPETIAQIKTVSPTLDVQPPTSEHHQEDISVSTQKPLSEQALPFEKKPSPKPLEEPIKPLPKANIILESLPETTSKIEPGLTKERSLQTLEKPPQEDFIADSEQLEIARDRDLIALPTLLNDASLAFREGDIPEAERIFNRVLEIAPKNHRSLVGLASVEMRKGNTDQANFLYRRVLREDPKNSIALVALISSTGVADPIRETSRLKQWLYEFPNAPQLHFALGNVYASQRQWNKAYGAFSDANQLHRNNPEILFNLAVTLDQMRNYDDALKYYKKALNLAQTLPKVDFNMQSVVSRMDTLTLRKEPKP